MIPLINGISERWFTYIGSAAFQATLLALFVLAALRVGRRWPPALRHAILMLAMCKFLVPPMLSLPTGVFSRIRPQEWFQSEPAKRYIGPVLHYEIRPLQVIKSSARHASSVKDSLNKLPDSEIIGTLPAPRPSLTTKGKLLLLHFSGVLIVLALAALQQLYLRRIAHRSTAAKDPDLVEIYDALCRNMHLRRRPLLRISVQNHAPVTFGTWKPVIILPQAIITALPPEEIRVILGHELAHHRRWDPWFLRLHVVASAIWWFNPVYWLLSRTVRSVREDCCDDMVVAAGIASRESYCQTLLQAARVTCSSPVTGAALAYFGEPHPLHRRFNRIMIAKSIVFPKLAGWGMLAVSVLALLLLPGVKSRALAQNSVRNATSPQSGNLALPELAAAMQTAAGSLTTESTVPEGNRKSQTSASTPQAPSAQENSIPPYYRKWLEEDVAYIISDAERSAFKKLTNDKERDAFIEQFWVRRNREPYSSGNSFKEEHYRRIAYANEHFAWHMPGWKTDRGRIYIMYGKPDKLESHPTGGAYNRPLNEGGGTVSTYPFEDWWYRHIDGVGDDIMIEFVDPSMTAEYRMAMSPEEKDALINVPGAGLTLAQQPDSSRVYVVGEPSVKAPEVLNQTLPPYTDEARAARVEGIVLIQAIIRKDGTVDSFKTLRGLGFGLDESAINTIATKWRFRPGTFNGEPVDVQANIEVSFRLFNEKVRSTSAQQPNSSGVYAVGQPGVKAPEVLNQTLPPYTDEARAARVEGIVLIQAIIRKDSTMDTFKILRGLGYGLDESAINTIATKWRFRPGTFNGEPVDVQANIEVSFRLFDGPGERELQKK
jgi:TonB family protein